MSVESVLVERARPQLLAEKARALVRDEITKGCQPELATEPVSLEPLHTPIQSVGDLLEARSQPRYEGEPPPSPRDLVWHQVFLSPDEEFDWHRSERFAKQLASVTHRVGLDISGNQEQVAMTVFCHRADQAIVSAAFEGEFGRCELAELEGSPLTAATLDAWGDTCLRDYYPPPPYSHLLTQPPELHASPYQPLITAMARVPTEALAIYQCLFQPVQPEHDWHRNVQFLVDLEYNLKLMIGPSSAQRYAQQAPSGDLRQMAWQAETKAHNDKPFFALALRVAVIGGGAAGPSLLQALTTCVNLFQHGGRPLRHLGQRAYAFLRRPQVRDMFCQGLTYRPGFLVNSWELAGPVHIPPADIVEHHPVPLETLDTLPLSESALAHGTKIGSYQRARSTRPVCLPPDLRTRHTHVIGRSGTGKSTLFEEMILSDIESGAGVAVLDPHGDLVEHLLGRLPEQCVERVIHFDPGDRQWVPIWNPLQPMPGQDLGRLADDMVGAFKSVVTGWGDRLEHILRHAFFGLGHLPQSTLYDVSNILRNRSDDGQRLRELVLDAVDNEVARQFWRHDFDKYNKDDFGPPRNKLSKLLISETLSLVLSQPDSAFSFRRVMDDGLVFLANLSTLGTEAREVLGSLMLSLFHQAALGRSSIPAEQRKPFHIYCDEAHRFVTDALEDLIAETRKYGVSLTLAHQYLKQFGERSADALSSVGTTIIFNVDRKDAAYLVKDLRGLVEVDDLISLEIGEAILRAGTDVVRIRTPKPRGLVSTALRERIIGESRRRYCKPVHEVREAVHRRAESLLTGYAGPSSDRDCPPEGSGEEPQYDEFP